MSSIYHFQMSGFNALWFKISIATTAMIDIIWQRRLLFLYPWLYHGFVGSAFHRTGMNFLGELNLVLGHI